MALNIWLMQLGAFKQLVTKSIYDVWTSNWILKKELRREKAIWRTIKKSVAVYPHIILVDKQGIIPSKNAVFDIYKRFWMRSQKHFFSLN